MQMLQVSPENEQTWHAIGKRNEQVLFTGIGLHFMFALESIVRLSGGVCFLEYISILMDVQFDRMCVLDCVCDD